MSCSGCIINFLNAGEESCLICWFKNFCLPLLFATYHESSSLIDESSIDEFSMFDAVKDVIAEDIVDDGGSLLTRWLKWWEF